MDIFHTYHADVLDPAQQSRVTALLREHGLVTFTGITDRTALASAAKRLMNIRPHRDAGPDGVTVITDAQAAAPGYAGFTNSELVPHTDGTSLPDPPGLLLLACQQPAGKLHVSKSLYEKIESGVMRPQPAFAADCDGLFATPGQFAVLQRDATRQAHPSWFAPRVELEESADGITDWEPRAPHGLLQTEEFARSIITAARPYDPPAVIEETVQARMERQAIFGREVPPKAWFVLYEASLVQLVGDRGVMRRQLDKLIEVAESSLAVIQVLPFTCADAPGAGGPLALFERPGELPVAYAEGWEGGRVVEAPDEVAIVITTLNVIKSCALGPKESLAFLRKNREGW